MPAKFARHFERNMLCVFDTETTGLDPSFHEIHQIAAVPLDANIKINPDIMPFVMDIKIQYPDRMDKRARFLAGPQFADRQLQAFDPFTAADLFDEWFQRLELDINRKIIPLAHNWPFDRAFIQQWLGPMTFNDIFHPHYRDTMAAASFIRDLADHKCENTPWSKLTLEALCTYFRITNLKAHDALQDCLATAEIYRRMLQYAS
jgi:DNA polymerase III epsilon subunit-like protein